MANEKHLDILKQGIANCRWSGPLRKQIEKYHILDFANWHDAAHFHKTFNRLLEGLNLLYK